VQPTATNTPITTATDTPTLTTNDILYVCLGTNNNNRGGVVFDDEDIVAFDCTPLNNL
jgi:hypothetical protein